MSLPRSAGLQPGTSPSETANGGKGNAGLELGAPEKGNAGLELGAPEQPRGWHSRGYLPHCDALPLLQAITFRLADALPAERLAALDAETEHLPVSEANRIKRKKIDAWLDAGMGCCALAHPRLGEEQCIFHW